MALLTCSVSVVTMMLVLIQAAGERGSQGGGWLITAQIASALALPFASDELARLPLVGAALYFVIYCEAQAAGLHEPRRPSVRSPGSRKWQRRRKAGAGVHGPAFPRQAAITLPVAASRAHAMIRIPSSTARAT